MKNPPNNLQLAVAFCAVQLLEKHHKQFHTWVGGGGKSRIMATIGLLALTYLKKYRKVHFVFCNKLLLEKDQPDFTDVWKMVLSGCKISYHTDLNFRPQADEVVILDEGDFFVFGQAKKFYEFS